MSDQGIGGPSPYNQPHGSSEEIRYDLNGDPIPAGPRQGPPPQPDPAETYAQPPSVYGQAPPPPPGYYPPPQQPYGRPPAQPGYGQPMPPPSYGPPPGAPMPPPVVHPPYGGTAYGAPGYAAPPHPGGGYAPPPAHYGAAPPFASQGAGPPKIVWYISMGVGFFLIVCLIILARANRPVLATAPMVWATIDSPDKNFTCTGPAGDWETVGSGVQGGDQGGLLFKKDATKIDITDSGTLSYMGDAMKTPSYTPPDDGSGGAPPTATPEGPVDGLHEMTRAGTAERFDQYSELDAHPIKCDFGDARISEWTASAGAFGGKVHGYRVTMLGMQRGITVLCQSADKNWQIMQPVFLKVIQSIKPGNG